MPWPKHKPSHHSKDTKEKIRQSLLSYFKTHTHVNKGKPAYNKGIHIHTEAAKRKISLAQKGKKKNPNRKRLGTLSKEHRNNISKGLKRYHRTHPNSSTLPKIPWNKGIIRGPPSEEHRKKISKALKEYYTTHYIWNKGIPRRFWTRGQGT